MTAPDEKHELARPVDPTALTLSPLGDAVIGAVGALVANAVVYPMDIVKTRMQVTSRTAADGRGYHSLWHGIAAIVRKEGVAGLYAGVASGLAGTVFSNFTYFYWYSLLRERYQRHVGPIATTAAELGLGALAGALSQLFVLPISVVTTRQQTAQAGERRSFAATAADIVRRDGLRALWSGFQPSMVLCSNPAITYGAFERCKTLWLQLRQKRNASGTPVHLHSLEIFLLGALSKTLATIVTYPYIMAKVRMQWRPPTPASPRAGSTTPRRPVYRHSWDVLLAVYREAGLAGWYRGMRVQISKAVLCQAMLFVFKGKLTWWTLVIAAAVNRRRQRYLLGRTQ